MKFENEVAVMRYALDIALQGEGLVEPNPMVGAVLVDNEYNLLGEGFHEAYGSHHAEVNAIRRAGPQAQGATLYVTLEPCCHHGKTPPCTDLIIESGIQRVVVAIEDPFPNVNGRGIATLRDANIPVEIGLCSEAAAQLIAPFTTLQSQKRPFVHAKWAMTLDGKIGSHTGHSQWITNDAARAVVHALRGRMDAILIGIGTALADNPQLTVRPPGPRTPVRIVLDSNGRLPIDSQLVRSARDVGLIVATGNISMQRQEELTAHGVEVISFPCHHDGVDLHSLLRQLGNRQVTNLLVEGGGIVLGSFFDAGLIDEVHSFIAPKLIGGRTAPSPILGHGKRTMTDSIELDGPTIVPLDGNFYVCGRVPR